MAKVEQSIEVNVSPRTAWDVLTRFEQYPRFMQGVEEVRKVDDRRLRWRTRSDGTAMDWDAEITQQVPGQCIAWRNLEGPRNEGSIMLQASNGQCTRVSFIYEREPAAGGDGAGAQQDLLRFKQFVEKLGRDSGEWMGREQDGMPSHSAEAELAAGSVERLAGTQELRASDSMPERSDAPQQPFGSDQADNASGGAGRLAGIGRVSRSQLFDMLRAQRWQDPLTTMRRMSDNMEQILGSLASASGMMRGREVAPGAWSPRIETLECPDRVLVWAELPGVTREEISVEVRAGQLLIEGLRQPPLKMPEGKRCSEFRYGRFHRALALPPDADTAAASAELRQGVLQVTVLRRPAAAVGTRIDISEV